MDIHIVVNIVAAPTRISCFMTDSDGNFLQKCDGTLANQPGETDGTFAIVVNGKNKEVATNPGQFYYNLIWNNDTGVDQVVEVDFPTLTGAMPNGANALHWLTFPTNGFGGVTPSDFDAVIQGNPAGANGPIQNITVPSNSTLYVTYHLEWSGIGSAPPNNCAIGCPNANQQLLVDAVVKGTFGQDECEAGALGYKNQ